MPRRNTLVATALLGIAAASCQTLIGSVDLSSSPQTPAPAGDPDYAAPIQALTPAPAPVPAPASVLPEVAPTAPGEDAPTGVALDPEAPHGDAGATPSPDSGGASQEPDAGPAPFVPRPVLVEPASDLDRVGIVGGDPRLGTCPGGVAIGVQPTANPATGTFGERLTFLELVCATVSSGPAGTIEVTRDDSLASWDTSGSFEGTPPTVVPDARVTWVLQPATLCPEAAPVLVGVSGTLDPTAPDDTSTDAIRSLSIECAPLTVADDGVDVVASASGHELIAQADSFATTGSDTYRSLCDGGSVITQIRVDSGFWLDGFVLGCSSLHGS